MNQTRQKLSKPASACWMLLPLLGVLVALQAIKFLAIFIFLIPLPLTGALILQRKSADSVTGQAARSFLISFLILMGLYVFTIRIFFIAGLLS